MERKADETDSSGERKRERPRDREEIEMGWGEGSNTEGWAPGEIKDGPKSLG